MSLIHEALKKLEGMRHGYSSPAPGPAASGKRQGRGRLLAALLVAIFAASGAAALYTFRGKAAPWENDAPENRPAAVKAREGGPSHTPAAPVPTPEVPRHHEERSSRGLSLYRSGEYKEASEAFRAALDSLPKDDRDVKSAMLSNLGMAYIAMDEAQRAEASFLEALALMPGNPQALNNYGTLLAAKGEEKKALVLFTRAAQADKTYPDPHLNIAVLHERHARYEDALRDYERYLELAARRPIEESNEKAEEVRKRTRVIKASLAARPGN